MAALCPPHRRSVGGNAVSVLLKSLSAVMEFMLTYANPMTLILTKAPTEDPDVVNFHRPGFFGKLKLVPPSESSVDSFGCACFAARLVAPNKLIVLPSPKPTLTECPDGAVLVRAKYASVCGSDMPYFKASEFKSPSSYWYVHACECARARVRVCLDALVYAVYI